jgi:hypothetical protein
MCVAPGPGQEVLFGVRLRLNLPDPQLLASPRKKKIRASFRPAEIGSETIMYK